MENFSARAEFEEFLTLMDEQIDWLESEASSRDIHIDLSDNFGTIRNLELLFDQLSHGKDRDEIAGLIVVFARYLGEWVRIHFGGAWQLPLDDPKNINFNTPVIEGHTSVPGLQFAPIFAVRAYALRRNPGTLQKAIEAQVDPKTLDLSGLQED